MKIRSRRLMALFLSAAMVFPASTGTYAEQATEQTTQAASAEQTPAEEQTQAQTQAPTEAQTQAQTQAPTEAQTQAQTQAPTEAQTQAQTQAPTEAQTQAPARPESQKTSEADSETEVPQAASFEGSAAGIHAAVSLPKGGKLPADTRLALEKEDGAKTKSAGKIRAALEKDQQAVSRITLLTLTARDKKGKTRKLPKGTKVTLSAKEGLDLGLADRREGTIHALTVGDKVREAGGSLTLTKDGLKLAAVQITLDSDRDDGRVALALAGLQNRENKGDQLDQEDVRKLKGASAYSAIAEAYQGPEKDQVLTTEDQNKKNRKKAGKLLGDLAAYSLKLADAQGSETVRVVNLYADDKGRVRTDSGKVTDPLYGISGQGGSLDVTTPLVVNVIAQREDQALDLPAFSLAGAENVRNLLVNVAAGNGKKGKEYGFVSYTGAAHVEEAAGVYLAPEASLSFGGSMTGAAYAREVTLPGGEKADEEARQEDASQETDQTVVRETQAETGISETEQKQTEQKETEQGETDLGESDREEYGMQPASEEADPLQKQTDPGAEGAEKTSVLGGLARLMGLGQTEAETEDLVETARETSLEAADEAAFTGTIQVTVKKASSNGESSPAEVYSGVGMSLWKWQGDTDQESWKQIFRWTSKDTAEEITAGKVPELTGGSYQIRQDFLPVDTGTGKPGALQAAALSFTITGQAISLDSIDSIDSSHPSEWSKDGSGTDPTITSLTCTNQLRSADSEDPTPAEEQSNPISIGVQCLNDINHPLPAGAQVKISRQKGEDGANQYEELTSFPLPGSLVSVDFKQWLTPSKDEAGKQDQNAQGTQSGAGTNQGDQGASNDQAGEDDQTDPQDQEKQEKQEKQEVFKVEEVSPTPGYFQTDKHEATLTFTYKESTSASNQGSETEKGSDGKWLLTKRTATAADENQEGDIEATPEAPASGNVSQVFFRDAAGVKIQAYELDQNGNRKSALAGLAFSLKLDQTELTSENVKLYSHDTIANTYQSLDNQDFTIPEGGELYAAILAQGESVTVTAKSGLREGLEYLTSEATTSLWPTDSASGEVTLATLQLIAREKPSVTVTGQIIVTGEIWKRDGKKAERQRLAKNMTIPVGLFADPEGTSQVGSTQRLTVTRNNSSTGSAGRAIFSVPVDAEKGTTYYLFALDEKGKPLGAGAENPSVAFVKGSTTSPNGWPVAMTAQKTTKFDGSSEYSVANENVTLRRLYTKDYVNGHPDLFVSSGSFGITLKVVDAAGKELPVDSLIAEFRVRSGDGKLKLKNNKKITLRNASEGTRGKISFPVSKTETSMSVTLMSIKNAAGVSLAKEYTLLTASYDNRFSKVGTRVGERTFSLKAGQEDQGPVVFVLRKNETNEKASLTLTKAVTYKKTPIRVNAVYYLGIFSDPGHKKLLFKKAMNLQNASSFTDTLKVNINSQRNRTITLYFAETDRKGKVVSSGKKTGYRISLNQDRITLSPDNMTETVVVTNEVLDGTKTAKRLTDPSSGFAGDPAALSTAQELAESTNLNSKTGDSTPLVRYLLLTLLSAAVVCGGIFFTLRRRRRTR